MHDNEISITNLENQEKEEREILISEVLEIHGSERFADLIQKLNSGNIHLISQLGEQKSKKDWQDFKILNNFPRVAAKKLIDLHDYISNNRNLLDPIKHQKQTDTNRNTIAYEEVEFVIFYTDGGYQKTTGKATFAVVRKDNKKILLGGRLPGKQSSYTAELYGILIALRNVRNNQKAKSFLIAKVPSML